MSAERFAWKRGENRARIGAKTAAADRLSSRDKRERRSYRPRNFNKRRGASGTAIQSDMCVNAILGRRGPSRSN